MTNTVHLRKKTSKNSTILEVAKKRVRQRPHPHIGVNLTNRCNLQCKGCIAGLDAKFHIPDKGFMSEKAVNEIIKQLTTKVKGGFRGRVVITGGEPSLHPDFIYFSEKFAKANLPLNISSNLTWIKSNLPPEKQPNLMALLRLLKYPKVRITIPMNFMHLAAYPKLPKIIKYFNKLLVKNGLEYGKDYTYCRIGRSLKDIAESAVACDFKINKQNAVEVVADCRPYLSLSKLGSVINFLQISPQGEVYKNMHSIAYGKKSLGNVDRLGSIVNNFEKKIKSEKGRLLGRLDPDADWKTQANKLLKIYSQLKKSNKKG